ncbi:MAG: DUF1552 domain-containing protein [Rhodospirillaceae bacterium]
MIPSEAERTSRRGFLRGTLAGTAVGVGVPFLDIFLNGNGNALASGVPLPVRFGTWFCGLGHTPGRGMRVLEGTDYEFIHECQSLEPYKNEYINYFSGFNTPLDGAISAVHYTGWVAGKTGSVPQGFGMIPAPTLDTIVADKIGAQSRFKSLELSSTGRPIDSYSYRSAGNHNAAEVSPLNFYLKLFGPEFRDPADKDFKPDPRIMLRQSVLSAVEDDRSRLVRTVGSEDKARLDQYFTSVRELEQQLEISLSAPPDLEACLRPEKPEEGPIGYEVETVNANHDTFSEILALALACDQTRVFNMMYTQAASEARVRGTTFTHHILSHEEPPDDHLGYQVQTAWFNERGYQALSRMLDTVSSVREGDGTLLDNLLIFTQTDTSDAKTHSVIGIPSMTIGKAGGRVKTGLHINGNAAPQSRIGLTLMQVMDVPLAEWGTKSLRTSTSISDILV